MVADISPEVLFIVHTGDSAVTTVTMESYTLFPSPHALLVNLIPIATLDMGLGRCQLDDLLWLGGNYLTAQLIGCMLTVKTS